MTEHNHHDHDHKEDLEFITLVDEDGNETLFEILFTFESEEYNKNYVLLYPAGTLEEDVELQAYSFEEEQEGVSGNLFPIETDEEWDMIEEVLNTFFDEE